MHQNDAMLFSRKNHHQTGKITSDQTGIRRPQYGQIYPRTDTSPLERLEHMDLDEAAGCCEHLHDQAEAALRHC
nr:Rop family plasmid primer RNA-binding protein [Enterobacter hormaechei]